MNAVTKKKTAKKAPARKKTARKPSPSARAEIEAILDERGINLPGTVERMVGEINQSVGGALVADQPARPLAMAPSPASSPMAAIEIAMGQPEPNMEVIERLYALNERHQANLAKRAYYEAFAAFKAKTIAVEKTLRVNYETKAGGIVDFMHPDIGVVLTQVNKAMVPHGLSVHWDLDNNNDNLAVVVTCVIAHVMGHDERGQSMRAMPDMSGGKNVLQGAGSSLTYLQRYTLIAACGLAPMGKVNEKYLPISEQDCQAILDRLDEPEISKVVTAKKLCGILDVPSVAEIPLYKLAHARSALKMSTAQNEATRKLQEQIDADLDKKTQSKP